MGSGVVAPFILSLGIRRRSVSVFRPSASPSRKGEQYPLNKGMDELPRLCGLCYTHAQSVWQHVDVIYEYEVQAATDNRISVCIPRNIETNKASEFPQMQKKNSECCDFYRKHINSAVTWLFHVKITHFSVARNGKYLRLGHRGTFYVSTNNSGFRRGVD